MEAVPPLKHSIGPYCLVIHHRKKVNLKIVVQGSGEQVNIHWPTTEKLLTDLLAKGPFGAEDLGAPAKGVCQNIELPWNKRTVFTSQRRRIAWATALRVEDLVPPSLCR